MTRSICLLFTLALALNAAAAPVVKNGSFEADRFSRWPGLARGNGGRITGWRYKGNVGVNPLWKDPQRQRGPISPYFDNGRIPDGKQVALLQNVCELSQRVAGFEAGKKYVVTYYENARRLNFFPSAPPRIRVLLGGKEVVSLHAVRPVDEKHAHATPFDYVESAVFRAPRSGAFELVFRTTVGARVTVFIDRVEIKEVK